MLKTDPGTLAIKLRVPNSLESFVFYFWHQKATYFFQIAASGNVYLVVAVTTNCMTAHGTGSLTLTFRTGE